MQTLTDNTDVCVSFTNVLRGYTAYVLGNFCITDLLMNSDVTFSVHLGTTSRYINYGNNFHNVVVEFFKESEILKPVKHKVRIKIFGK